MSYVRGVVVVALTCGCTLPNPAFNERDTAVDGDTSDGLGDGDQGDGDDDPGTGDGDPSTGDGDGDATTDPGTSDTGDETSDTGDPCPPELTDCGGECLDLSSDNFNCETCGHACDQHQICSLSECVPVKYVFVTSVRTSGELGGIEGAAQLCAQRAAVGNLPGIYAAWLSIADNYPEKSHSRVGPYVRTDAVLVARTWEDLVDGQLDAPIDRDESGAPIQPAPASGCQMQYGVWTGTTNEGYYTEPSCTAWAPDGSQGQKYGVVGDAKSTVTWSTAGFCAQHCSAELPIYCVQQ